MTHEKCFSLKAVESSALNDGKTITRFAEKDECNVGTPVKLTDRGTVSSGEVVSVDDNPLFGDKVICTIKKH